MGTLQRNGCFFWFYPCAHLCKVLLQWKFHETLVAMALAVWDCCCTSGPFPSVVAGIQLVAHRKTQRQLLVRAWAVWRLIDKNLTASECLGTTVATKIWPKLVMPFHRIGFLAISSLSFPAIKSLLLSNIHREMGALNHSSLCWDRW